MKARSSVQAKATPKAKAKPSGEGKEGTALPVALGGLSRAMHSSASRVLDSIVKVIEGMTMRESCSKCKEDTRSLRLCTTCRSFGDDAGRVVVQKLRDDAAWEFAVCFTATINQFNPI